MKIAGRVVCFTVVSAYQPTPPKLQHIPLGSPIYAAEALVAEMSAAYLCAEAGISPAVVENQAAYVQGWLAKLRSDKRLVVIAAAQAQRAADYILNRASAE